MKPWIVHKRNCYVVVPLPPEIREPAKATTTHPTTAAAKPLARGPGPSAVTPTSVAGGKPLPRGPEPPVATPTAAAGGNPLSRGTGPSMITPTVATEAKTHPRGMGPSAGTPTSAAVASAKPCATTVQSVQTGPSRTGPPVPENKHKEERQLNMSEAPARHIHETAVQTANHTVSW